MNGKANQRQLKKLIAYIQLCCFEYTVVSMDASDSDLVMHMKEKLSTELSTKI